MHAGTTIQEPLGGTRSDAASVGLLMARAAAAIRRGGSGAPLTGEDHSVLSTARVVLDSVADALRFVSSRGVTGHSPSNFSAIEFAVETAGAQHVSPAELSTMLVNVTTELDHFVQSPAGHESRVLVEFFSNLSAIATRDAGSGGETSPTVF